VSELDPPDPQTASWLVRAARTVVAGAVDTPLRLAMSLLLVGAFALALMLQGPMFDSDILNILPQDNGAVQGLRLYDDEFDQNRELAFVLEWEARHGGHEAVLADFISLLSQQPWVVRVLDGPPIETGYLAILPPLILNRPIPPDHPLLNPNDFSARLAQLKREMLAGSPRAEMELAQDPLGLVGPALQPVVEKVSMEHAFDLISPDGKIQVVPCLTNQEDLSPAGCHELMRQVDGFIRDYRIAHPDGPLLHVTGRSAYVDQVSLSMERDIKLTSSVSLAAVIGIFWLGYRRLLPLLGIALLLALAALVATALGQWIYGGLNLIAIGFCSILFGLGDDFSLLICQRYENARSRLGSRREALVVALAGSAPGIAAVTLTTAVGFCALNFAGSAGFRQLGGLVALGLIAAAALMLLGLPLFLRGRPAPVAVSRGRYVRWLKGKEQVLSVAGGILLLVASVFALGPWQSLRFDLSPRSLEPANAPAAVTLQKIMEAFPESFEPALVIIDDLTRGRAAQLDAAIEQLKEEGLCVSSSSPSPFVIDSTIWTTNVLTLEPVLRNSSPLIQAVEAAGLNPMLIEQPMSELRSIAATPPQSSWVGLLPETSSWWFLLDRLMGRSGNVAAAQLQTPANISVEERLRIAEVLQQIPDVYSTGWSQALALLMPWAQQEFVVFGVSVIFVIAILLALIYRNLSDWLTHLGSLALSVCLAITGLKLWGVEVNLLNVLALPLVIGVGVDYGTHILLAAREGSSLALSQVLKPIFLSGLTTIVGFGSLALASNPSLAGLGKLCAIGVASCLLVSLVFLAPTAIYLAKRRSVQGSS